MVTDPWLRAHGPVDELVRALEQTGAKVAIHGDVQTDPTVHDVRAGLEESRAHAADGVVAIGGGSPIDAAKAIAALATRDGYEIADAAGYDRLGGTTLPLIAIPTTAGSGSEQTRATVIADPDRDVKLAIYDDVLLPAVALVDHRLAATQPRDLAAHVGLDALVHALEAHVSRLATPFSDMLALAAARLVWPNLELACDQPDQEPARAATMYGASLAGAAFSNASVCLIHGMSRPIGAWFHIPHGLSNALLLLSVTRFSLAGAEHRYADLARGVDMVPPDCPDDEACEALLVELARLVEALEIPSLSELGVSRESFEDALDPMAAAALESGSPGFNPRIPSHAEIVDLYREVY